MKSIIGGEFGERDMQKHILLQKGEKKKLITILGTEYYIEGQRGWNNRTNLLNDIGDFISMGYIIVGWDLI